MSLTVIIEWIISPIQPSLLSFQINLQYLHLHQQQPYKEPFVNPISMRCSSLVHVNYANAKNDHEKRINYMENLLRYFSKRQAEILQKQTLVRAVSLSLCIDIQRPAHLLSRETLSILHWGVIPGWKRNFNASNLFSKNLFHSIFKMKKKFSIPLVR